MSGEASIEARSSRSPDVHVHVHCTVLVVHERIPRQQSIAHKFCNALQTGPWR